ncbi:hypothetical protein HanIR_Chr03g0132361 [Helianthus annuus]|nr:hypothetical protein HanIR_Chr03g0132361 [Helianthus annuus]
MVRALYQLTTTHGLTVVILLYSLLFFRIRMSYLLLPLNAFQYPLFYPVVKDSYTFSPLFCIYKWISYVFYASINQQVCYS